MTAYALAHLYTPNTHDDVLLYLERIQATLDPFGGTFLAHGPDVEVRKIRDQEHGIHETLDWTTLVPACEPALERGEPVSLDLEIRNVNRTVGTILGSEVSRRYGGAGLPDDTIRLALTRKYSPEGLSTLLHEAGLTVTADSCTGTGGPFGLALLVLAVEDG